MNNNDSWQALLARSSSTFHADTSLPYGLVTSVTARLRAERTQQVEMERIGWRALMASFCALAVAAAITVSVNMAERTDFDPGVRSLLQVDNIQIS